MKYKLLTFLVIIFLVFGSIVLSSFYNNKLNYVYHQHLEENADDSLCINYEKCSHLPIVNINTKGDFIPGIDHNKEDYLLVDVNVYDNKTKINYLADDSSHYKARLRYRGRSSVHFDKKGYSLKFVDNADMNLNVDFLGMPSDNSWVLHAPYLDKSLIRNYMWYNISQEIMNDAPKTRFFELYLDEEYQGLYLAVESVSQSKNSRVKMTKIDKDSYATSYLLLVDAEKGNDVTYINSFTKYTEKLSSLGKYPSHITIKYPNEDDITPEVKEYIYDDFAEFERMIYSFDYREYEKYIDVDNFIDYFIINEFTLNYDAGFYSTYIYKDVGGKYKMYPWDFNSANNNYSEDYITGGQSFKLQNIPWYKMMIKDPEFVERIINRYRELRKSYLSEEYLYDYVDSTVSYLGSSVDRNYELWGYSFDPAYSRGYTNLEIKNYDEAISQLKDTIHLRGEWMDKNIETLRQYSHESANKKFNK